MPTRLQPVGRRILHLLLGTELGKPDGGRYRLLRIPHVKGRPGAKWPDLDLI